MTLYPSTILLPLELHSHKLSIVRAIEKYEYDEILKLRMVPIAGVY